MRHRYADTLIDPQEEWKGSHRFGSNHSQHKIKDFGGGQDQNDQRRSQSASTSGFRDGWPAQDIDISTNISISETRQASKTSAAAVILSYATFRKLTVATQMSQRPSGMTKTRLCSWRTAARSCGLVTIQTPVAELFRLQCRNSPQVLR